MLNLAEEGSRTGGEGEPLAIRATAYRGGVASYFDHDKHRKMMDAVTGRTSVVRMMEDQRKMLDLLTAPNPVIKAAEDQRKLMDLAAGRTPAIKMMEDSRKLLDTILTSPARASALGAQRSISQMIAQPSFASMVGTSAYPRPAWMGVLHDLRDFIPDDLYADTEADFIAAGEAVEATDDGETWWIARLSTEWQLRLLLAVLTSLYLATDFAGKTTGAEMPPELAAAIEALAALAATILLFMEAKARLMKGESPGE